MKVDLMHKTSHIQSLINKNFKHKKQFKLIEKILNKYDVMDEIKNTPRDMLTTAIAIKTDNTSIPILTPLAAAIYTKRINIIEAILDKNINLNTSPLDAIHLLEKPDSFSVKIMKYFIDNGFDINHSFILPKSLCPINMFKHEKQEVGLLDFAIQSCVSTMLFDNEEIQPYAFKIASMLIDKNAPLFDGGADVLCSTITHHSEKLLKKLLEHPDLTPVAYEKTKEFVNELTQRHSHSIVSPKDYELLNNYFEKKYLDANLSQDIPVNKIKKQKI